MQESLIVPLPAELIRNSGEFTLTNSTKILAEDNPKVIKTARFLAQTLRTATGFELPIEIANPAEVAINVIVLTTQGVTANANSDKEGYYTMDVANQSIVIRAKDSTGLFYGVESLRQLLPPQIFSHSMQTGISWTVPNVQIVDYPRFQYRGLMLDVARNFMGISEVKRILDLMALHKLNVFHWHLTDDEGWRIQIKTYPELTNIGAWRGYGMTLTPAFGSGIGPYGGYYTQDEIRNIVQYAADRHITIVPEVDMPGHMRAMIKSLPNLLTDPEDTSQYVSAHGYTDNVLSPCIESTFTVIGNVIHEVAQLFPGKYIHVGSDEVPEGVWQSPKCKALMQQENLHNKKQLQNYFLRRVEKIVKDNDKYIGGWEEVIDGGENNHELDKTTQVYSWLGVDAGIDAAKRGYPVIMEPVDYLYFDLAYSADPWEPGYDWGGYTNAFTVYKFAPIPDDMPPEVAKNIIGVEGAIWTENIAGRERLDYLAFPKMAALSELAWTPKDRRNWRNFSERLAQYYFPRMDNYGINYRIPLPGINVLNGEVWANITFPGLTVRYTFDGSDPNQGSTVYTHPMLIPEGGAVKMRAFAPNNRAGRERSFDPRK